MIQSQYGAFLKKFISLIHNKYEENELAYLSLTSKVENPLRDKIAFEFQKEIGEENIICREWTNNRKSKAKADIAILDLDGKPKCIIEFKAHSSILGVGQWANSLKTDFEKNKKLYNQTEVIFVLFANFINELPKNPDFENAIKYYDSIKKSIKKNYSLDKQVESWEKALERKNIISNITNFVIKAGKYQKSEVQINTFIHEKITINEQDN